MSSILVLIFFRVQIRLFCIG
ncbi:hypothetical protein LINPERPRIM_LOCUS16247 [Linum perenne]